MSTDLGKSSSPRGLLSKLGEELLFPGFDSIQMEGKIEVLEIDLNRPLCIPVANHQENLVQGWAVVAGLGLVFLGQNQVQDDPNDGTEGCS